MLFAQEFGLGRRKEALHCGVPAVSTAAHAAYDAVGLKQTLEVLAGCIDNWERMLPMIVSCPPKADL